MEIILRKGLYCETFGYFPPETVISLPADSDDLGKRLVARGYAKGFHPEAEPKHKGKAKGYEVPVQVEWISTPTEEPAADDE